MMTLPSKKVNKTRPVTGQKGSGITHGLGFGSCVNEEGEGLAWLAQTSSFTQKATAKSGSDSAHRVASKDIFLPRRQTSETRPCELQRLTQTSPMLFFKSCVFELNVLNYKERLCIYFLIFTASQRKCLMFW